MELEKGLITFTNLEDAREMLDISITAYQANLESAKMMVAVGMPKNCESMHDMRKKARRLSLLILSMADEFQRLHNEQCPDPLNCSLMNGDNMDFAAGSIESQVIAVIRTIDQENRNAEEKGIIPDPDFTFEVIDLGPEPSAN